MQTEESNPIGQQEHIDAFLLLFDHIYKGNVEAMALSMKLLEIAHTWDDLVDGEEVSEAAINKAFIDSIFTVQTNPMWFNMGLNHHVLNVFLRWQDANSMEKSDMVTAEDLEKTHMLRAGIYDLFVIIAYYLHGNEWAAKIGPLVRKTYGETAAEIKEEFLCQIQ